MKNAAYLIMLILLVPVPLIGDIPLSGENSVNVRIIPYTADEIAEMERQKILEEESRQLQEEKEQQAEMFWTQQATRLAESYLKTDIGFPRKGLIEQLEYEGFTDKQAMSAVQSLEVDWKQQAVISAQKYIRLKGFSFNRLIEQLEYEGYTHEEAVHGTSEVIIYN